MHRERRRSCWVGAGTSSPGDRNRRGGGTRRVIGSWITTETGNRRKSCADSWIQANAGGAGIGQHERYRLSPHRAHPHPDGGGTRARQEEGGTAVEPQRARRRQAARRRYEGERRTYPTIGSFHGSRWPFTTGVPVPRPEALRAGIPSVVVPAVPDQAFWAGGWPRWAPVPPPIPPKRLTAERLSIGHPAGRNRPRERRRCRLLGEKLSAEDGTGQGGRGVRAARQSGSLRIRTIVRFSRSPR
jgi:hypothetical protein